MFQVGRYCQVVAAAAALNVLALFSPAKAQTPEPVKGAITIFTDGLAQPSGRVSRALGELVVALDRTGRLRAILIAGYGGVANVRDLLHSRGVDVAIINSDVLAYLDLTKEKLEAKQKLRYVTSLVAQRVFLLARGGAATIAEISGKKLAVLGSDSEAGLTARTIFGLSRLPVNFDRLEADQIPPEVDAVLFLEEDAPRFLPLLTEAKGFRLVPLPMSPALAGAYQPAVISPAEAPGLAGDADLPTLRLDTLLAVFDWAPIHGRYADVSRFIDGFFTALPALRGRHPGSIWTQVDVKARIPGWRRYAYAEAKLANPAIAQSLAPAPAAPLPVRAAAVPDRAAEGPKPADEPLRLTIAAAPPLADQRLPQGGLMADLTGAVLKQAFDGGGRELATSWAKDRDSQIAAVLKEKAAHFAAPLEAPSCEQREAAGPHSAALCDGALLSEPLFRVVEALFVRAGEPFELTSETDSEGRVVCTPADREAPQFSGDQRRWIAEGKLRLVRPATLIDCLSMMQRREADGVVVNEIEGRFTIARLGLGESVLMMEKPVSTRGLHIAMAKDRAGAAALMGRINTALAALKSDGRYAEIVSRHLPSLQGN
jgi:hypothetical protein